MDYYEEMGLARTASPQEIRTVYKALVRVLHPDTQPDESTRNLADLQLRRVNGIAEVLLNPKRRRRYDLTLELPPVSRPTVIVAPAPANAWRWRTSLIFMAAGIIIGCLAQFGFEKLTSDDVVLPAAVRSGGPDSAALTDPGREGAPVSQTTGSTNSERESGRLLERAVRREPAPRAAREHAAGPPVRLHPQPAPHLSPSSAPQTTAAPATPPPVPPLSSAAAYSASDVSPLAPSLGTAEKPSPTPATETLERHSPFTGHWTYAAQFNAPSNKLYAPEYIELSATVDGEFISGSFRSRYYVTNQPLSPAVNFDFFGRVSEPALTADWVASDGARGTVSMRLLPSGVMRVDWVRNKAGSGRTLAYGHAVLLKERDSDSER